MWVMYNNDDWIQLINRISHRTHPLLSIHSEPYHFQNIGTFPPLIFSHWPNKLKTYNVETNQSGELLTLLMGVVPLLHHPSYYRSHRPLPPSLPVCWVIHVLYTMRVSLIRLKEVFGERASTALCEYSRRSRPGPATSRISVGSLLFFPFPLPSLSILFSG